MRSFYKIYVARPPNVYRRSLNPLCVFTRMISMFMHAVYSVIRYAVPRVFRSLRNSTGPRKRELTPGPDVEVGPGAAEVKTGRREPLKCETCDDVGAAISQLKNARGDEAQPLQSIIRNASADADDRNAPRNGYEDTDLMALMQELTNKFEKQITSLEQSMKHYIKDNVQAKINENALICQVKELKEEFEKLSTEKETLIETNTNLNRKIDDLTHKTIKPNQNNQIVNDLIAASSVERDLHCLKAKLSKTEDDFIALVNLINILREKVDSKENLCAKIIRKYGQMKTRLRNIEKNVTDNTSLLHRADHAISLMVATGYKRVAGDGLGAAVSRHEPVTAPQTDHAAGPPVLPAKLCTT